MKPQRNVLLTFDYELFLGDRSGTIDKCMIQPTEALLQVLSKHKARSVFFVDTIYLHRLKEVGRNSPLASRDYEAILQQLSRISGDGHYLFHHIHPHWLDAKYLSDKNEWENTNNSKFALSCLGKEERNRMFEISQQVLDEINPHNTHEGFRAGGLFILPIADFTDGFKRYGIANDFSVLPGFKANESFHAFDFTQVKGNVPYHFSNDVLQPDNNGTFTEFPITAIEFSGLKKILIGVWNRVVEKGFSSPRWGDGIGSKNKIYPLKKNSFLRTSETCSVENLSSLKSGSYRRCLHNHSYLHLISHPKLISRSQVKVFDRFLDKICKQFEIEFDFMKFDVLK